MIKTYVNELTKKKKMQVQNFLQNQHAIICIWKKKKNSQTGEKQQL